MVQPSLSSHMNLSCLKSIQRSRNRISLNFSQLILYTVLFLRRFSSSVQEELRRGEGDLSDLVSINIQRGRERGVPGYTKYRNLKLCGLSKVKSFNDLTRKAGFKAEDVANLKKVYRNVRDIDLFVGGE